MTNRSDEVREARITAIDDAGQRSAMPALSIGPKAAVNFNSNDLEHGNAEKGLMPGAGTPSKGDWRLEISAGLDVEVLSYIRSWDGFVTPMHDQVERGPDGHAVPTFNPGRNWRQASLLRLINPGATEAQATVSGVDDTGAASAGQVGVTVPAGGAMTLSAAELESADRRPASAEAEAGTALTGALGEGTGKWRLLVKSAQPIQVMSLLMNPTGHLSNLSTSPNRTDAVREVAENAPGGVAVGEPVTVGDGARRTHALEGPDASLFEIDAMTGQIRTRDGAAYDFEARSAHAVVVRAPSELWDPARIRVAVQVADVDEPPGKPEPPRAESNSPRKALLSWDEPSNTGPEIDDYDVEYRPPATNEWTDAKHDGAGREIEIGNLRPGYHYRFRVRASNAEGTGEWSEATSKEVAGGNGGGGSGGGGGGGTGLWYVTRNLPGATWGSKTATAATVTIERGRTAEYAEGRVCPGIPGQYPGIDYEANWIMRPVPAAYPEFVGSAYPGIRGCKGGTDGASDPNNGRLAISVGTNVSPGSYSSAVRYRLVAGQKELDITVVVVAP